MSGGYAKGITPRGDRLVFRVYTGRDPLTRRETYAVRTVARVGKREAEGLYAAFRAEVKGQRSRERRTFGELLDRWYDARAADWSPTTAYQTRRIIDGRLRPSRLGALDVADVTVEELEAFYGAMRSRGGADGRPLSTSTVIRVHGVIRLALGQAVRWGWLTSNPADLAEPGRADPAEIVPPAPADVARLLEAAEAGAPDLLVYLALDSETGARRGELGALRLSDVDVGASTVTIARALAVGLASAENERRYAGHYWPASWTRGETRTALIEKRRPKTRGSVRTVALSASTLDLVRAHRRRLEERALVGGVRYPADGFLFPSTVEGDRPIRPDSWTRRFTALRDELGLQSVRLHDLRHFVATSLLAAGVDLATVAGRLGHGGGGKTTLAIYSHFLAEPDRVASDVMAALLAGARAPAVEGLGDVADVVPIGRPSTKPARGPARSGEPNASQAPSKGA